MKIAMPIDGDMLNQHFGQSRSFLVCQLEEGQVTNRSVISSEALQHNHAGLSGLLISEGVSLVITGGIGGPALQALQLNGLKVIRGASGSSDEVLAKFLNGQLQDQNVICNSHSGDHHHQH